MLQVRRFLCSGEFETNCYVVWPGVGGQGSGVGEKQREGVPCWVIDPGFGVEEVVRFVGEHRLEPGAMVLTHGHLDHAGGVPELRAIWPDLPIWLSRAEADALQSPGKNLSAAFGLPWKLAEKPDRLLDDGDELKLGPLTFRVIVVVGHSPGGLCYHCPATGDLFSGDVLFAGSIGRSDLPGGDGRLLVRTIRQKLLTLDGSTRVWPGHGPATTIREEMTTNPYVRVEQS